MNRGARSHGIAAISLDLDDTLWPIDSVIERAERCLHEWFERFAPRVAAALPPAQFALYRRALAAEHPAIAHDFTSLRREAIRRALATHGEDTALAEPAMEQFLAARNQVELYPDALQALARLAGRFPLVALTNGNADLDRIGISAYFAGTVNARTIGYAKPDARIFEAARVRLDVERARLLHVGDDPDLDVRGAARFGARAAWINRAGKPWVGDAVGAAEFSDLIALCDWLGV